MHEGSPINQPENQLENTKEIGRAAFHISEELIQREQRGFTHLFSLTSGDRFAEIANLLGSEDSERFAAGARAFEEEVEQFGRYKRDRVDDDLDSLETLVSMFRGLVRELEKVSDKNHFAGSMIESANKTQALLERRARALSEYLS